MFNLLTYARGLCMMRGMMNKAKEHMMNTANMETVGCLEIGPGAFVPALNGCEITGAVGRVSHLTAGDARRHALAILQNWGPFGYDHGLTDWFIRQYMRTIRRVGFGGFDSDDMSHAQAELRALYYARFEFSHELARRVLGGWEFIMDRAAARIRAGVWDIQ